MITPQVGNCTICARYVEAGYATQVILNARLTRMYEREDWARRLAQGGEALRLERGIAHEEPDTPEAPSPIARAVEAHLSGKGMAGVTTTDLRSMRARRKPPELTP